MNVEIRQGDGYNGWPEHALFVGIIVTAGRYSCIAILTGAAQSRRKIDHCRWSDLYISQELLVLEKDEKGMFSSRSVLPVLFVPLTR